MALRLPATLTYNAGGPSGPAVYEAAGLSTYASGTAPTATVTVPSSSYMYAIVLVAIADGAGTSAPTSVTFDGNTITSNTIGSVWSAVDGQGEYWNVSAYYYQDPVAGSRNAVANFSGSTIAAVSCIIVSNVNQTPASAFVGVGTASSTNTQSGLTPAVTSGIASGDLIVGIANMSDASYGDASGIGTADTLVHKAGSGWAWNGEGVIVARTTATGTSDNIGFTNDDVFGGAAMAFGVIGG